MTPGFKPFTVVHNSPLLTSTLFLHWIYLIENSRKQELPFFGNTNKNGRMKWGSYISGSHKRIWMGLTDNYNDIYLEFYWQMTKDPIFLYYLQNPFWGLSSKQASCQASKLSIWESREKSRVSGTRKKTQGRGFATHSCVFTRLVSLTRNG